MLRNWFIDWSVKSEICMAKQKAEDAGSILCVVLRKKCFPFRKPQLLLLKPNRSDSTDWMQPTDIIKGNLLYLQTTDSNC